VHVARRTGGPAGDLSGFGKEGLISRKPTWTVTDQAWAAIMSAAD
jgi:hypothetical protein